MQRLVSSLLIAFVLFVGEGRAAPASVIIGLQPYSSIVDVARLLNGTVLDAIPGADIYLLSVPDLSVISALLQPLTNMLGILRIKWYEVNTGVTQPPHSERFFMQAAAGTSPDWYKRQPAMRVIHAGEANVYSTGRGVVIADVNSQVDYSHPALVGHLTTGHDFVETRPAGTAVLNQSSASFLDQSSASFLDDSSVSFLSQSGASFLDNPEARNPAYGHGTLTAGVIAAVAPESMIMPLRAFDDEGTADLFILAKAIRYAADNGAQVINMSFGTKQKSNALKSSIDYALGKGLVAVASAGNDNTVSPQYPAAFAGVLSTGATDLADVKAGFSNYGLKLFGVAPGVNIISPYPDQRYVVASGTSFSAPALAGTVGLVRSLRFTGVVDGVASGAVNIDWRNPEYANQLGYGRIDALRAVKPN